ncbi:MAG: hypothetical protein H6R13_2835 [Proteobacteria bacterium]|nr:hypothetical protein [Pseudomonadota bacterium]
MKPLQLRGYLAGVAAACLLSLLAICVLKLVELQRRGEAREAAHAFSLKLVERVNEAAAGVYMLTASVDRQTGMIVRFEALAEELLSSFPLLRALELAPGGVIRHIHPIRGNEAAFGHDLLVDKTRNREVHLAISRRQMAVAGPLTLRQGGVAVLARYPLYTIGADGRSRFWGLSIGLIDFPSLLLLAGEGEFARLGYGYEICWKPIDSEHCKNVKGEPVLPADDAVSTVVGLSQAEWHINVTRHGGWLSGLEIALAMLMVIVPAILTGRWVAGMFPSEKGGQDSVADLSTPAG